MSNDDVKKRMEELCEPIDRQILMCDNKNDILMLGCAMLEKVKTILEKCSRSSCGPVCSPSGLYLTNVIYPEDPFYGKL